MRIGVIDSGVGGLSILDAVRQQLSADYIYVMDNRYLPYGEKTELFIQQRLAQLSALLIALKVDLIVIACNTATTQAVASLRQQFAIPFVGTVPAIKPAALLSQGKPFAVLATPGTCQSAYLQQLIAEFAPDSTVCKLASSELVLLAEQKVWQQSAVQQDVAAVLQQLSFPASQPLYIVLGCTHFPLLSAEIQQQLPGAILLDTAEAIAKRVKTLSVDAVTNGEMVGDRFISTAQLSAEQLLRLPELGFTTYQLWPDIAPI